MEFISKIKLPNENHPRMIKDSGAVRFDTQQSLTDEQKLIAKTNIGALVETSTTNGNIKINNEEKTVYDDTNITTTLNQVICIKTWEDGDE